MLTGSGAEALEGDVRVRYLDALYLADGRDEKSHPLHGRYSGLLEQRQRQLTALDRAMVLMEAWQRER